MVHEKVATSNSHPDWKRLCQHTGAYVTPIRQKFMMSDEHDIHHDMTVPNHYTAKHKHLGVYIITKIKLVTSQITLIDCCQNCHSQNQLLVQETAKTANIPNILYM